MTAPVAAPVKAKSTKAKKATSTHPPYFDMVKHAIKDLKERNGSSRQAIAKYIKAHYKVDDKVEQHLRRALVSAVKSGKLQHTKGIGASGSFKLAEKAAKVATKPKSPKAKRVKKAAKPKTPKPATAKKPKVVKAKKPKKATTPKKKTMKPKRPVAKKTPKKVVKKAK